MRDAFAGAIFEAPGFGVPMLHQLEIENYAVASKLRVRFHAGLNLLTGETGSGKSIIVDAFSLLLGARAATDVIRAGASSARIAGVFEIAGTREWRAYLAAAGIELDDGDLIVEREVLDSGKSRAYINGRLTTVTALRELSSFLGDIHGQHEQQDLFESRAQLDMLDAFAETESDAAKVAGAYECWRDCEKKLAELRGNEKERLRLLDLYRFQAREIEAANLEAGEEERLEQEKRVLGNLARVQAAANRAYDALYDSAVSATVQLKAGIAAVDELAQFKSTFETIRESLASARAVVDDASMELRDFVEGLEADPARLDDIENRLAALDTLKRKYGPAIEAVIAYGADVRAKLTELESSDASIAAVEKRRRAAATEYEKLAGNLSAKRKEAAGKLEKLVEKELASLAMEKARFQIAFQQAEAGAPVWTSRGIDRVVFLISANPGEPPRPLAQVASGGELSRITLALKTCLTANSGPRAKGPPRTLIFDEIDSGVGGRVAESLGRRLKRLAERHQVLCVTHLPQVAGFADAHYFVAKAERNGTTHVSIDELDEPKRVEELARMFSGAKITEAALQHARQILKSTGQAAAS